MSFKPIILNVCCSPNYLFLGFRYLFWTHYIPLGENIHSSSKLIACPPSLSVPLYSTSSPHILSLVLQACLTIFILCSHSLRRGIIINSHLGEGRFPHHRMQWRFIATISDGLGEMYRMRERWKLCTYTTGYRVTTVWPCMSTEVDGKGNGWQMLRTVNEQ